MNRHFLAATVFATLCSLCLLASAQEKGGGKGKKKWPQKELYSGEPVRALIITGGCCHNYLFQTFALGSGVQDLANVAFEVVNVGGTGTSAEIPLYDDPDWAKPYEVVIHNECFAKTTNPEYIRRITEGHADTPAVVVHCAMHTYRDAEVDDWRRFLGVTSRKHEHQSQYAVEVNEPTHPVLRGFPSDWVTPKDELYIIEKLWPGATALASSVSEKTGETHPVIWVNDFNGTRVAGTTYGHSDDTFRDPVFIRLLANAILWAAGKD
ncbi:MAG: ThuA domain-containing protein [Verrucomicrobiota bacterium]